MTDLKQTAKKLLVLAPKAEKAPSMHSPEFMEYMTAIDFETIQKLARGYLELMAENERLKCLAFIYPQITYKERCTMLKSHLNEAHEVIEFYSRHRSVADLIAYGDDDESHSWNRARSYLQKYKQGGTE
jgi:hypothetical protein